MYNHDADRSIYETVEKGLVELGQKLLDWRNDKEALVVLDASQNKMAADIKAHNFLTDLIRRVDPDTPVVSEEDKVHKEQRPSRYWIIDPIDGTASWRDGYDGFVTQLALIVDNVPVFSLVEAPALKKSYKALQGEGTTLNGVALKKLAPSSQLRIVDNYPQPRHIARTLVEQLPATAYVESGSLGLKICLVADGTADLFVKDIIVRDWDIAPAWPVINEVGGIVLRGKGEPYLFEGSMEKPEGIIAVRDQQLAERVVDLV